MSRPILLDTCAVIWIIQGAALRGEAEALLAEAEAEAGGVVVSPMTAWEIGVLVSRGRLALSRDPAAWFGSLLDAGVALAPLSPQVLIASSFLPGAKLRDPADRILAATARAFDYRLMTRDHLLLDYGAEGHLAVIAC